MMKQLLTTLLICTLGLGTLHAQPPDTLYQIGFQSGDADLRIINSDGTGERSLLENTPISHIWYVAWSATQVAIVADSLEDGLSHLWILTIAENRLERIMPINHLAEPEWSPDGTRLAFSSTDEIQWNIYVMNADGSDLHTVVENTGDGVTIRWSPDGEWLGYTAGRIDYLSLYIVRPDGSGLRELVKENTSGIFFWSPAGTHLSFEQWEGSDDEYTVNVESGEIVQLLDKDFSREFILVWSPDGSQLVLSSDMSGRPQIYLTTPDGENVRQLTEGRSSALPIAWSPDGRYLAIVTSDVRRLDIVLLEPNTNAEARVLIADANPGDLQWSPDGSQLFDAMWTSFGQQLSVIDVESGEAHALEIAAPNPHDFVWVER
jgi:TolB protein